MQTSFRPELLADPEIRDSERIIRTCVHCGFCTATCPTYVLLGDELDSPRGRIYLIKKMLEEGRPADARTVRHVDRCLSCLSCMTTCPSGVHYMHLVDHARAWIDKTYRRPLPDRWLRALLAAVLPRPALFRWALLAAALARPLRRFLPASGALGRVRAMLELAPPGGPASPSPVERPQVFPPFGRRRARVAYLVGCAQPVLAPEIGEATIRLLRRAGAEVVVARGAGCCGALVHHMGKEDRALRAARANIEAWLALERDGPLDAVVIDASGCGTTVKDYGWMFRHDPETAEKAARIAALALDASEILDRLGLPPVVREIELVVAYHAACSMQHGQKITDLPKRLLTAAGFTVREPREGHLCCGSAGTYNLLQPELATRLKARKIAHLERTGAAAIATGNIGCIAQLRGGTRLPVLHTVQLLDWATGGPVPAPLAGRRGERPRRAAEGAVRPDSRLVPA
ncbi:MAG: glycolate oxidase subunit GlcF [Geminicoccaceae bacterium]|nr:glycolate oxidase subunit GlcF [Geminicoccaceae bacterium]